MAVSPMEASSELAMNENLSRFWSTVSRKFEWDRPHHRVFVSSSTTRSSSEDTWDTLVAQDLQPSLPNSVKDDTVAGDKLSYDLPEGETFLTSDDLLDCEYKSGQVDWSSFCDVPEGIHSHQGHLDETTIVNGASIGDVPTRYVVKGLQNHEFPVVGTYVDPRVISGFSYAVRQADSKKLLFQGRALRLVSIGMGYGKRLTFASESYNHNNNYFWSDTHPEGYGFAIKLVQEEDKFTLRDANDTPVATAEVDKIMGHQKEMSQRVMEDGSIEKRARVSMVCKVHYFHLSHADPKLILISGVAVSIKPSGSRTAVLKKVTKCSISGERGFTLVAGTDTSSFITVVDGEKAGDIPIQYSITGLQPHELPVIGTYVDPRILTGFRYRVRPADSKKHLFGGSAITLQSIGKGYGKRLTFASNNLNNNENYFWSDTNPEGYGFSIQAVCPGDAFRITSSSGEDLGRAQVFRADAPQVEERTDVSSDGRVTKRVRVTVTCDVSFHGEDDRTLIVTGTALVMRKGRVGLLQRLEDVAVSSQINLIYRHNTETLVFLKE